MCIYFKKILKVSFVATLLVSSVQAMATDRRVVYKDGKAYSVETKTGQNNFQLSCDDLTATVMVQKLNDMPANIMATLFIEKETKKEAIRIFNVGEDWLQVEHDISNMDVGCLSKDGGVGIFVPSQVPSEAVLHIQLDKTGRTFKNYNLTGHTILSVE